MIKQDIWQEAATTAGFSIAGVTKPVLPDRDKEMLGKWLSGGNQADMDWITRSSETRISPTAFLPSAQSVMVVGLNTCRDPFTLKGGGRIARYAVGRDYHRFMNKRLERLAKDLARITDGKTFNMRRSLDIHPVLERALAVNAGLGWQGKQSQLITTRHGPWLLLGALFIAHDLVPGEASHSACGSCSCCMKACPTGAITNAGMVDSRRCISYLTIEAQDLPPRSIRSAIGNRFFGCDTCLEACPHGTNTPHTRDQDLAPHRALTTLSLGDFLTITPGDFNQLLQGTPLRRPGRIGLARNAAIVAANIERRDLAPELSSLLHDDSPILRGISAWALGQLGCARDLLEKAYSAEPMDWVKKEMGLALGAG